MSRQLIYYYVNRKRVLERKREHYWAKKQASEPAAAVSRPAATAVATDGSIVRSTAPTVSRFEAVADAPRRQVEKFTYFRVRGQLVRRRGKLRAIDKYYVAHTEDSRVVEVEDSVKYGLSMIGTELERVGDPVYTAMDYQVAGISM